MKTNKNRQEVDGENVKKISGTDEGKYKNLFMASRDAIMTLEPPTWKFTSGNPATIEMFKAKDKAEFLSCEPWKLSPEFQPDGRPSSEKAIEMIEKAMRDGSNFFEWVHQRFDGENFFAEVLLSKVTQDGKVFLHAVVRDITDRKNFEKKLAEYTEELEDKVAERTRELADRVQGLEALNKIMTGRELKMAELKKEIKDLKKQN